MTEWIGNMEVRLYQTKDTFPFKWADAKRYCEEGVSLVFASGDANCWVQVRLSTDNCAELIRRLAKSLQKSSITDNSILPTDSSVQILTARSS